MKHLLKAFRAEEDGNTTIDWIVLTAGVMLLSTAVLASIGGGGVDVADATADTIAAIPTDTSL